MTPESPVSRAAAGVNLPVSRSHCPGLTLSTLDHGRLVELHLTLTPLPAESWGEACRRLHEVLSDEAASIVGQMIWGPVMARDEAMSNLKREFGPVAWPVTWTEGADLAGRAWSGMQVWAIRGAQPQSVQIAGQVLGCEYRDTNARRVLLGGLGGDEASAPKSTQAARTFEQLEATLARVGLNLSHVARTWFFLDDILGWYGDFNQVRTEFFKSRRVFEGLVPASTGVGTRNPGGAAVAAAALALEAPPGKPVVAEIPSPAQCPATSYGSSFSRAVEIRMPRCRQVIVSGTASIEPGGRSVRPDDLEGQIELTFEVIGDILKSRGLDFTDTTRATAYFKTAQGAAVFAGWLARRGWKQLPIIATTASICRDELLFELELDAAAAAAKA
jgi:enamine deaminase RidA (YjgF/YER057c/UK114 family)